MTISEFIQELEAIKQSNGDVPVRTQSYPDKEGVIEEDPNFFAIVEESDDGIWLNLRSWPY